MKDESEDELNEEPKEEQMLIILEPKGELEDDGSQVKTNERQPCNNQDWPNGPRASEIASAMKRARGCSACTWSKAGSKGCKQCLGKWEPFYRATDHSSVFWDQI